MSDLHSALKTTELGRISVGNPGFNLALVKLQYGKNSEKTTLHAGPTSWLSSGLQSKDLLEFLGFTPSRCAFLPLDCYVAEVRPDFNLNEFSTALPTAYTALRNADQHLSKCGIFLQQRRKDSISMGSWLSRGSRQGNLRAANGDGHTAPKSQKLKESEDQVFRFVLTWIDGGSDKGWTTHYRPKHPPLSSELQSAFDFLNLHHFNDCPEFDFERCDWAFTSHSGDPFDMHSAERAHAWFDAHAQNFSAGIEHLLSAHLALQPFGLSLWRVPSISQTSTSSRAKTMSSNERTRATPISGSEASDPKAFDFEVALSFAGPQRPLAQELAERLSAAGVHVFYDNFYPEHLWGKNLVDLFDEIYRKKSRYCVMFISKEYVERIWTNHERQSAQARALKEKGQEYILPIKVEEVEVPGLPPTIAFLPTSQFSIEQISELLIKKLRSKT